MFLAVKVLKLKLLYKKSIYLKNGASIFLLAIGFLPHKMQLNLTCWVIKYKLLRKNLLFVLKKPSLLLMSYYIDFFHFFFILELFTIDLFFNN